MKKNIVFLLIFALLVTSFYWAQEKIRAYRVGIRVEEKILMLSNRPEVTKVLSLGFDGAVASMLWIRAIQYFGGNFSSLDEPEKKQGLINLFDNMFALDPQFVEGYRFAGFVINESVKDSELAIDYLMRGAAENPEAWRLPFEAGFIAFYQLEEYELAKDLFTQAAYGMPIYPEEIEDSNNIPEGEYPIDVIDGDISTEIAFAPDSSITLDLGTVKNIGRMTIKQNNYRDASFNTYASKEIVESFDLIESVTKTNFHLIQPPIEARYFKFAEFQPIEGRDQVLIADFMFHGPRNEDAPTYVDRMAIEMDRKSGRFSAAWNQYWRYYEEAMSQGDQTSAQLALEKLQAIYNEKAREILVDAIELYRSETGELPSADMNELVEQNYIQRIVQEKVNEDPNFYEEVYPVIFRNESQRDLLTTFDGQTPVYLITFEDPEGEDDWYISSRSELLEQQSNMINRLQNYVDKFEEEMGRLPNGLAELKEQEWFTESDTIFEDPLQGYFELNQETGKVEAKRPAL